MISEKDLRKFQKIIEKEQERGAFVEYSTCSPVDHRSRRYIDMTLDDYLECRKHNTSLDDHSLEELRHNVVRLVIRFVNAAMRTVENESILVLRKHII